ncbi:response regulator [bacterium]|nr:response regulator [bacterium]
MPKKILVVESSPEAARKLVVFLQEMKYTAKTCDDARQAVTFTTQFKPDLIIANASLPVISGTELARLFKSHEVLAGIPFLLMAYRRPPQVGSGVHQRVEADDYITLPLDQTKLYSAVTRWLESEERPTSFMEEAEGPLRDDDASAPAAATPFRGRLTPVNAAKALLAIVGEQATGNLRIKQDRKKMKIPVERGRIVNVYTNFIREDSFGRFLVREGKITPSENAATLERAKNSSRRQGEILVQLGVLNEDEMARLLGHHRMEKVFALFTPGWLDGYFEFRVEPLGDLDETPLNVAIADFVREGVLTVLKPQTAWETLERNGKIDQPLRKTGAFADFAQRLGLSTAQQRLAARLDGVRPVEFAEKFPDTADDVIRLAFLLAVGKAMTFETETARPEPKATAPEPRPKAAARVRDAFDGRLREAREAYAARDWLRAIPMLEAAVAENPESSETLVMLAYAIQVGSPQSGLDVSARAKEMLKRAITLDDHNDLAHLYLGQILKSENMLGLAETHFKAAHRLNPMNDEAARELKLIEIKRRSMREKGLKA